jgi:hypothetical protein
MISHTSRSAKAFRPLVDAAHPFALRYRSVDGRDTSAARSPFDTSGRTVSHSIVGNGEGKEART